MCLESHTGYSYEIDLRVDCGERMSADTVYKVMFTLETYSIAVLCLLFGAPFCRVY